MILSIVKRGTSDPEELWCREARIRVGAVHIINSVFLYGKLGPTRYVLIVEYRVP